ncbi:ERCC4 domain-containing protein [Ruminiclostridium josui]|uniref:ERCC4 domain-containing protein n=1 Tax=Ruminiclostridium josui TaxID=1499 RepID=UPI000466E3AC|nr:ERCC4 domain-containing protein [Ruminiclostridium josui]
MIDFYRYTDTELKKLLQSITIVIDTREQNNKAIIDYFTSKKIPFVTKKLDYGDYTCFLPSNPELGIIRDTYIDCYIERKNGLSEISGNLTSDRSRLEEEFQRAKGKRFILMVEESAGLEKIIEHKYNTEYNEKSFLASLFSFGHRYRIDIHFIDKKYAGMFIYMQMYYAIRELLKA